LSEHADAARSAPGQTDRAPGSFPVKAQARRRPAAAIRQEAQASPDRPHPAALTALLQNQGSGYSREYLRESVLAWAARKWPEFFTGQDAFEADFERHCESSRVRVTDARSGSLAWSFSGIRPDLTASRLWETRILFLGRDDHDLLLVSTGYLGDADPDVHVAQPAFMCPLIEHLPFEDGGYPVCTTPRQVLNDAAFANFRDHLLSRRRALPMLVLGAHPTSSESRDWDESRYVDARSMARRLCGLAHVVCLGPLVLDRLRDWLGSELAVDAGGARLFMPGLEEVGGPGQHPGFARSPSARPRTAAGDLGSTVQAAIHAWSVSAPRRLDFDALWSSVGGA